MTRAPRFAAGRWTRSRPTRPSPQRRTRRRSRRAPPSRSLAASRAASSAGWTALVGSRARRRGATASSETDRTPSTCARATRPATSIPPLPPHVDSRHSRRRRPRSRPAQAGRSRPRRRASPSRRASRAERSSAAWTPAPGRRARHLRATRPISEGAHTFRTRAIDAAGNTDSSAATRTWTVDTTAPNTTIGSAPSDPSGQTEATFTFTSSEAGSSFDCRLDGGAWAGCSTPKSYAGLAVGPHSFEVRAKDAVGNVDPTPDMHLDDLLPAAAATSAAATSSAASAAATAAATTTTAAAGHRSSGDDDRLRPARHDDGHPRGLRVLCRRPEHLRVRARRGRWSACASPKEYTGRFSATTRSGCAPQTPH